MFVECVYILDLSVLSLKDTFFSSL